MILTFKGPYGSIVDLRRDGEIQGYEFVEPPIEYRFLRAGSPISDWTSPLPGFISLLRPATSMPLSRREVWMQRISQSKRGALLEPSFCLFGRANSDSE
jgi:hypothetical protein